MSDRVWRTALLGLLTGILLSQWVIEWRQKMRETQSLAVLRSIESLLRQHNESNEQIIASLEDIADAVSDIHSHVEGFGTEKE
jgi:type II secretory pathway pseudopilin PulG